MQETFLPAWRAAHRYDPELSSLRVWLFAIARNVVIDVARHRSTGSYAHVPGDADLVQNLLSSDPDRADRGLDSWVIEEALGRVSAEHRAVIVETYLRGRSYDEIAGEWDVRRALRSRAFYALKALRVAMDEMGVTM